MNIYSVIAIIVTAFAAIFGGTYFGKFKLLVKELREAFATLEAAMEDDKITSEEFKAVVKEFLDILTIWK